MTEGYSRLTPESLGGGDCLSQFQEELDRAILNILDVNKDPTVTRTVTVTVKIKPIKGKERLESLVEFQASSKLPPDAAGIQPLYLARGVGYVPKAVQLSIDDAFDPDTGEVTKLTTAKNGDGDR